MKRNEKTSETLTVVLSRMTSSRLPGKALVDINGSSNLKFMLNRVKKARHAGTICVATTTNPIDDAIVSLCKTELVKFFRGDEDDVLGRVFDAANFFHAKTVIRLTADCPLIDPDLIDQVYEMFASSDWDYVSNGNVRSFPDGLDVEVFSYEALKRANDEAKHPFLREHVTPYIRGSHPEYGKGEFNIGDFVCPWNFGHIRWTLDTPEDLEVIRNLLKRLPEDFTWMDALAAATKPPVLL